MVTLFLLFALSLTSTTAVPNLMELMVEQNVTIFPDLVETAQLSEMLATSGKDLIANCFLYLLIYFYSMRVFPSCSS